MPIVRCLKCKKSYDPGVDEQLEELEDLPGDVSLKVVCPACGQWLRLPENEPIPTPAMPPELLREMMGQSRLVEGDEPPPRTRVRTRQRISKPVKPWWKFW